MPGIFSRRRGSTGQVHNGPVSSSAAIAATSAFLKNSPSTTSLSSAAAAAALRSQTTSPEPIAHLQTKRMMRRGSQSSNGSGSIMGGPQGQRQLSRRGSSGSMTERSFRSPSPGRGSPHTPRPAAADAPPVPSVPAINPAQQQQKMAARSSKPLTAGQTAERAARLSVGVQDGPSQSRPGSALSKLQIVDRDSTASPVNFSRPITAESPPVSPARPKTAGAWFGAPTQTDVAPRHSTSARAQSSSGLSSSASGSIEAHLQSVANAPVMSKKKKASTSQQGARLAAGSLSPKSRGTEVTQDPSRSGPEERTSPAVKDDSIEHQSTGKNGTKDTSPSPSRARRPSGMLHKQPSVVMEVPEPDEAARARQDGLSPKIDNTKKSPRSYPQGKQSASERRNSSATRNASSSASPRFHSRPASLEVPDTHAKSAHFSNDIVDSSPGVRHNPPARSVSPAKSALKHSPSSSIRTSSPAATFSPSTTKHPGSDTSDSMSVTSQDGARTGRKKRAVRVSFDEETIAATVALDAQNPASARRSLSPRVAHDDEVMRPRPALPLFGSVRTSPSLRAEPGMVEKSTETLSASPGSRKEGPEGVSHDHAIASILRNAHGKSHETLIGSNDPLPPEVTTVEGNGQVSDHSEDEEPHVAVPQSNWVASHLPENHSNSVKRDAEPTQHMEVPDIQVLPATPGFEESTNRTEEQANPIDREGREDDRISVPGSWDDADDLIEPEPVPEIAKPATGPTESFGAALQSIQPDSKASPVYMPADSDSDSDDSAAFSDAAEDPSELEPFGYASMDAIVESPVPNSYRNGLSTASPSIASQMPDSSPDLGRATEEDSGWAHTSAYWSKQKHELRRRESDQYQEDLVEDSERGNPLKIMELEPEPEPEVKQKLVKPKPKSAAEEVKAQVQPRLRNAEQPPKQVRSSMRTSMRTSVAERTNLESPPPTMRKTMRGPAQTETKSAQPLRAQTEAQTAMSRKTMRPMSASGVEYKQAPKPRQPPMKPAQTEDSDSESSFKRKRRPASIADPGRYAMKRSMRSGSVDAGRDQRPMSSQGASGTGRWSVRSMSPTPTTPNKGAFRQSLRGSSIPEAPTMRGQNSRAKAKAPKNSGRFSMSGFSKGANGNPASVGPASAGGSRFKSRFADSDSEDNEVAPAVRPAKGGFRSRFHDSDDEDQLSPVPADPTPVRGIMRQAEPPKADLSDIDDSSDDEFSNRRRAKRDIERSTTKPLVPSQADIDKAMAAARQNVAVMTGNQDLLDPQGAKGKMQKRGVASPPATANKQPAASPAAVEGSPVARRKGLLGSIFGRRDSESSKAVQSPVKSRQDTVGPGPELSPPQSPASSRGKLQRKNPPKMTRTASGISTMTANTVEDVQMTPVAETDEEANWPLTPPPKIPASAAEERRPTTSDGVPNSRKTSLTPIRPTAQRSQSSGHPLDLIKSPASNGADVGDKTEKKKRFGRLRKAFGLHT